MAKTIPSEAQLLSLGFVKAPANRETGEGTTNTLYTHPGLPDLLFKRVANYAQAIACGATAVIHPASKADKLYAMVAFGAYALSQFHANKPDSVAIPSKLRFAVTGNEKAPIYVNYCPPLDYGNDAEFSARGRWSADRNSGVCAVEEATWYSVPDFVNGYRLGVISKASDGLICRAPENSNRPEVFFNDGVSDIGMHRLTTGANYQGNLMSGLGKFFAEHAQDVPYLLVPATGGPSQWGSNPYLIQGRVLPTDASWFGFVDAGVEFDVRGLIAANKAAVLATVDGKVQGIYSTAWDEVAATLPAVREIHNVRVYPHPDTGLLSDLPFYKQGVSPARDWFITLRNLGWTYHPYGIPAGQANTFTPVTQAEVDAGAAKALKARWPIPFDVAGAGDLKLPVFFNSFRTAEESFNPLRIAENVAAAKPLEKITLGGQEYSAGDIVSSISPLLTKPAAGAGAKASVDNAIKAELVRLAEAEGAVFTVVVSDNGMTEELKVEAAKAGERLEKQRRAIVDALLPSMSQAVRRVAKFINEVDAKAIEVAKR